MNIYVKNMLLIAFLFQNCISWFQQETQNRVAQMSKRYFLMFYIKIEGIAISVHKCISVTT